MQQPLHRRPCLSAQLRTWRRDPYSAAVVGKDKVTTTSQNNFGRWLWVPAFAGTTEEFSDSILKADTRSRSRDALRPRFASSFGPLRNRGRREDRVLAAPAVSRAICANKTAHEHTGQLEHSGLPCAMALRLTSCSSRRTALLPPSSAGHRARSEGSMRNRQLSASTAAPEPHDFAVRFYRALSVHRISPHVRDDGQRPSSAVRQAELCG
jgi:hypothetical protein